MKKAEKAKSSKVNWAAKVRKFKTQLNDLTAADRRRSLKGAMAKVNGRAGEHTHTVRKSEKQYSARANPSGKPINWEAVCERTRQRCNKLSDNLTPTF